MPSLRILECRRCPAESCQDGERPSVSPTCAQYTSGLRLDARQHWCLYEVRMKKILLAAVVGMLTHSFAHADDWPQFRGSDRTGVSKEKGLLKVWPKAGPKLLWTYKDAGIGFSTVAVSKGVVYTLGTDKKFVDEYVIAIDEKSGKELWTAKIG